MKLIKICIVIITLIMALNFAARIWKPTATASGAMDVNIVSVYGLRLGRLLTE